MSNVKEKLYNCAGGEEDLIELNKVTTCTHFREENRQQDEECSHVHVCNASFHWQNTLHKHPWHRQLFLSIEKLSFSMGSTGKEKKKKNLLTSCGLSWADFPRPRRYRRARCWFHGHSQAVHWSATGWPSFLTTAGCELSSTPLWSGEHPGMVYKSADFKPYPCSLS